MEHRDTADTPQEPRAAPPSDGDVFLEPALTENAAVQAPGTYPMATHAAAQDTAAPGTYPMSTVPASSDRHDPSEAMAEPLPAGSGQQAAVTPRTAAGEAPADPGLRRGLFYLAICLLFALGLLAPNLLPTAAGPAPSPCGEGAVIGQAALLPQADSAAPPILFAVVRPPAFPNVAPGNEPGCQTLYRSADGGVTWTVSFSATAEAPVTVDVSNNTPYLFTQRVSFSLYVAGNIYRSDGQGANWTWNRVSPQGRHDVPMVAITDLLHTDDGALILRAGNGDGAALLISRDGSASWQPVVIPELVSVGSVATLRNQIAVTPPIFKADQPPGLLSSDHGATWQPMGMLPGAPQGKNLRLRLSGGDAEGALVLDLVPARVIGDGGSVARYRSFDGGRHWSRVKCGNLPTAGCAVASRWATTAGTRFVLFHQQLYHANAIAGWKPLPVPLPVPSSSVLQVLAASDGARPTPYLVTSTAIWQWNGTAWHSLTTDLPLSAPAVTVS